MLFLMAVLQWVFRLPLAGATIVALQRRHSMSTTSLRKAGGSVTLVIPPSFLKANGLGAGSEVALEVKGDKLVVTSARKRITMADIIQAAPADARELRVAGWDELPAVGAEI